MSCVSIPFASWQWLQCRKRIRGKVIYEKLGLTAQHMADEALKLLQGRKA